MSYIMALDQGTTSSRCILFDEKGQIYSMAQKEFTQIYPKPGWVEHDPMEIWSSQYGVISEAMAQKNLTYDDIAAIGITNQRETTILWNRKTGEPVYNAIVWQCRRTAPMIDRLEKEGYSDMIRSKTGLVPDAYFSGTKIAWILDNVPNARKMAENGELLFGTVDTWLLYRLTRGKVHATDYTNASRTMLFNIHTLTWDKELLEILNIPESILPKVYPSGHLFGTIDNAFTDKNIPIAGIAGDQQAALFGQCCFKKGDVKNTYGTGCFMLMHTGEEAVSSEHGLLTTLAAVCDETPEYALEGSVFVGGAAMQWLRDGIKLIRNAGDSEAVAYRAQSSEGMYVVPAFAGIGAPYWNPYARGMIVGITRGCSDDNLIRATLESIAYQTNDLLSAMREDAGVDLNSLKVDGGACVNNYLMQFQADIMNASVYRPECVETTALGAAYLAGLAIGFYSSKEDIAKNWKLNRSFSPVIFDEERSTLLSGWHRAVKAALYWGDLREE